jgi:hypothetical protein
VTELARLPNTADLLSLLTYIYILIVMQFANVAVRSTEQTRATVYGRPIIIQITAGRTDICQATFIFEKKAPSSSSGVTVSQRSLLSNITLTSFLYCCKMPLQLYGSTIHQNRDEIPGCTMGYRVKRFPWRFCGNSLPAWSGQASIHRYVKEGDRMVLVKGLHFRRGQKMCREKLNTQSKSFSNTKYYIRGK